MASRQVFSYRPVGWLIASARHTIFSANWCFVFPIVALIKGWTGKHEHCHSNGPVVQTLNCNKVLPISGQRTREVVAAIGPKLPLTTTLYCCEAARRRRHSCIPQHFRDQITGQPDEAEVCSRRSGFGRLLSVLLGSVL